MALWVRSYWRRDVLIFFVNSNRACWVEFPRGIVQIVDLQALERILIANPDAGDVIPGTGGLRKLRFAPPSWHTGKRGGVAGNLRLDRHWAASVLIHLVREE